MSSIDVTLGIRTQAYRQGLQDAKNHTKKFKTDTEGMFSGLGGKLGGMAAGVAGLIGIPLAAGAAAQAVVDFGGDTKDLADSAGTTTEQMQRLQGAFEQSGARAKKVALGVSELNKAMSEAMQDNEDTASAFERLGVSLDDLAAKADDPQEIIFQLAEGFKNAADQGQALKDLQTVLGAGAKEMRAGMRGGADELRKAYNEATVASDRSIDRIDTMGDKLSEFKRKALVTGATLMAGPTEFKLIPDQVQADRDSARKVAQHKKEEANRERFRQQEELNQRKAREKAAQEAVAAAQDQAKTEAAARASISHGSRVQETRRRIRELIPGSLGNGHAAIKNRAKLAEALAERGQQLRDEALMTPDERREARRDDHRRERAAHKADRALRREFGKDAAAAAKNSQGDATAQAIKTGNEILDNMLQLQKERLKGLPK